MPVITVSGHSRKVGKTSIAEGLIASLPEYGWTALKVSSHRHSGDSSEDYTVIEETSLSGGNDTSRFLKAGARRAFWIQAGRIEAAIPAARAMVKDTSYVMIEGNSVLDFIAADFSILVLNGGVAEFKESARSILPRADALVLIRENAEPLEWENLLESVAKNTPRFEINNPKLFPPALADLLRSRL
jgi:molybdopterin-guanine dinucleotide biosynthesis protein